MPCEWDSGKVVLSGGREKTLLGVTIEVMVKSRYGSCLQAAVALSMHARRGHLLQNALVALPSKVWPSRVKHAYMSVGWICLQDRTEVINYSGLLASFLMNLGFKAGLIDSLLGMS
jgi:hypothetical protein